MRKFVQILLTICTLFVTVNFVAVGRLLEEPCYMAVHRCSKLHRFWNF